MRKIFEVFVGTFLVLALFALGAFLKLLGYTERKRDRY